MKAKLVPIAFCLWPLAVAANTNPAPVVVSASMRTNTLMDVVYRVDDPDNASVKVRALAFIDGTRSFAKILRPVTFIEGTGANIGDGIAPNTNHTLTWDVGADWSTNVGQVKFEILALDDRGLLPIDWISIPATNGQPALTISRDAPSTNQVMDALFWLYASGDPDVSLSNGVLTGTAASGAFSDVRLASGGTPLGYATPFLFKRMNLDPASSADVNYAQDVARAGLSNASGWHAINRAYGGLACIVGWGFNDFGQCDFNAPGSIDVTAIAVGGSHSMALMSDGTVIDWGNVYGSVPPGLTGVTAIAAGSSHSLALRSDGTVIAWGNNNSGQTNIPAGLTGVTAIAAGYAHSAALRGDGTVAVWGSSEWGQLTIPSDLSNVTAIATAGSHTLALKSNGTVVAWGSSNWGETNVPPGLSGVTAIAAGSFHSLALLGNGTVVGWGNNDYGQITISSGLSNVTAIVGGAQFSMALKSDGTVTAWGWNVYGQTNVPPGLSNVTAIGAGSAHGLALRPKSP